jgi:RNA polymerase sigma factor (sigma-70 family)
MDSVALAVTEPIARSLLACQPALLRRARSLVGYRDAEDLVQSTFERALHSLGDFVPGTNMQAWLRRIMFNLSVDEWRRGRRLMSASADVEAVAAPDAEPPPPWDDFSSEDVQRAVRTLSPRFRQVFELFHQWGLSYSAIAGQLQLRAGTVGTRLMRARLEVRETLVAWRRELGPHGAPPEAQAPPASAQKTPLLAVGRRRPDERSRPTLRPSRSVAAAGSSRRALAVA